jgi:DnaJ-class molecular chaperone
LGLAENASAEQIEFAYKTALDKLRSEDLDSEQAMNRLKVLKKAYSILGSPARREIYDAKLKAPREIHYEAVASSSLPWI